MKLSVDYDIYDFSVWLRTVSNPVDINQFRSHTGKIFLILVVKKTNEISKREINCLKVLMTIQMKKQESVKIWCINKNYICLLFQTKKKKFLLNKI